MDLAFDNGKEMVGLKNVIFLLVDCFDYNKIGSNEYKKSATPFLDWLKTHSYWCEKMYSQAPYTEAALIATMCGYDTMTRGAYLKRYKHCPETLFQMIQKGGYEVYAQMWTHFYPSSAIAGIDSLQLRPFSFKTLWYYRLEYFAGLYDKGELDPQDIEDLADIIGENLRFWKIYCEKIMSRDKEVKIVLENMDVSKIPETHAVLLTQIALFEKAPKAYVEDLLKEKLHHTLFQLFDEEALNQKLPEEFREKISKKYAYMGQKIYRSNQRYNLRNNRPSLRRLVEYFKRSESALNLKKRTMFSQYLRNYYHILKCSELLGSVGERYDLIKDWLSTQRMMEYFLEWEKERKNSEKPYFAYMHTEDIHGQCAIFDICCKEESKVDRQMQDIEKYLQELPRKYRGNLGYDLGLINIDKTIEWFYRTLEEKGILQDSILVITSDHGCGTNYHPLRGEIQNFHDECYHVPFIVCGAGITAKIDRDFHITKDTMATLADLTGIQLPESSNGISVFAGKKRDWVNQEYMGPGCPDMFRRPIWMCGFDEKWKVFIKAKLMQDNFDYTLEEIYHLEKDKKEMKNLASSKTARRQAQYLIDRLEERWKEIKNNYARSAVYEK